jgi:uncharacterized protein
MQVRPTPTAGHGALPSTRTARPPAWRAVAAVEVALACVAVALDLLLPALVILGLAAMSLVARGEGPSSIGLCRPERPGRLAVQALGLALAWSLVNVGLTKPALERLAGDRQDVSAFADVEGNVSLLLVLVVLSWTLAAFVETVAFTGFVVTRTAEVFGAGRMALTSAVLAASLAFGFLHTEQGVVGVAVSTVDAVFYAVLRYRYGTLWAPILTHGFINTIGMLTFFLAGPIYGLW